MSTPAPASSLQCLLQAANHVEHGEAFTNAAPQKSTGKKRKRGSPDGGISSEEIREVLALAINDPNHSFQKVHSKLNWAIKKTLAELHSKGTRMS